jgi:hypothetical protein
MPDEAAPSSRVTVNQVTSKSGVNLLSDHHVNDNNKNSVNNSEKGFLDGFNVKDLNDVVNTGNVGIVGSAVQAIIGNQTAYYNSGNLSFMMD